MTKEDRDRREAEKRARMEGSPDIGGATLPFSRKTLLKIFWGFVLVFPVWTLWNARTDLTFETTFAGSVLFMVCLLPGWFWVTGRVQGLPIFPIFSLTFLPTYVTPLWQGHSALAQYTPNEINTAAWTVTGFLLICQLFWQQSAVRAVGVPQAVRMINLKKAEKILIICLTAEVVFEVLLLFFFDLGGGAFAAVRGFATAAGRMGIFVLSYQIGQAKLKPLMKGLFLCLLSIILIQETASLVLATVIPTIGLAIAGYVLGSGKIPWKALISAVSLIGILHAGKYEMRELYLGETSTKERTWTNTPAYFTEWIGFGLKNLGLDNSRRAKKEEVSSAKERASLIQLMIKIQTMTPTQVPFLQGQTYRFIPSLLIPRFLSPQKARAHTGNMILSLHYRILDEKSIFKTSVAFDPIMEAYANFGFWGVFSIAVIFGFFTGFVTRLSIHVPMLSFGFLYAVQVIAATISAFNTAGVFVTTIWQSFLALCGLSLFLMSKQNNPVWKYYGLKLAEKLKFKTEAKLKKTLEEVNSVLKKEEPVKDMGYGIPDIGDNAAGGGRREGAVGGQGSVGGPTSLQASETQEELRRVEDEVAPVKHERPTRYVYGEKKK